MIKIFIDPGHGGADSGAVGNGLKEKDLTLKISKTIKNILADYQNVEVRLSRDTDKTLSLKQRTDLANSWGADFLISVHINAGGGIGYEDYSYIKVDSFTDSAHKKMHEEVTAKKVFKDRGIKKANFHMLRESRMPAVLTECGFIDNRTDSAKLKNEKYLYDIARGHAMGIVRIFQLKKKERIFHKVRTGDTFYSIARHYGLSVRDLQNLNPHIKNINVILPAWEIKIK